MTRCVRCPGSYESDGYCGECGHPAPEPASVSSESVAGHPPLSTAAHLAQDSQRGSGLTEVPPIKPRDPSGAVLGHPQVPPRRRRCRVCDEPVGQATADRPGRDQGFCPKDGTPFSFVPGLSTGDLVETRYEILGCLAYGGLGWIYLAKDTNLSDAGANRWVVLKGLIDVHDPDAVAAAVNERRFLVEVDHPGIVKIFDFVRHRDRHTNTTVGYIVMEYLGGRSLLELYRDHRVQGRRSPLPLTTVLAYGIDVLRALAYLHDHGLVYCDLKPDNVMHVGDQVKLIDLGAVQRMNEPSTAVYGTPGYQAPELELQDLPAVPGIASDIYTVGRTLAVLSLNFEGFSSEYRHRIPEPADAPLLADHDSYRRLLHLATHPDPGRRFSSADEMREQLHLVLAEVASRQDRQRRPVTSARFTPERHAFGTGTGTVSTNGAAVVTVDWAEVPPALPAPLVDPADPAAGFLATLGSTESDRLIATLLAAPVSSPETVLRLIDARIAVGDVVGARNDLAALTVTDWRADWYHGVVALAENNLPGARAAFEAVYDALPGELAPKLALAAVAERDGDFEVARSLYEWVWHTDFAYVSAAFGLARMLHRAGRPAEAVTELDSVPDTSIQHLAARVAAIRAELDPDQTTSERLRDASRRLDRLRLENGQVRKLAVEVLTAKLDWTMRGLGGQDKEFDERTLRRQLELAYRDLAKLAAEPDARSVLVDRANLVRPRTLF